MLVSERHVNERLKISGELNESFAKHFQYSLRCKASIISQVDSTFLMTGAEVIREVIEI